MAAAELVPITERIVACRDPTDDKFLELALNGSADLILTGDDDLLVLTPFRGIPIVAAATFVQGVSRRQLRHSTQWRQPDSANFCIRNFLCDVLHHIKCSIDNLLNRGSRHLSEVE